MNVVKSVIMCVGVMTLGMISPGFGASGQATSDGLDVKAVAEVQSRSTQDGRESAHLAPATRVTPGDEVLYTLEIRNTGVVTVKAPTVIYPVPAHMKLIAESATGPGTEITFSTDGGRSFLPADDRTAAAAYTHVRWNFKNALKANSVAFLRFRAIVK